jgi:4-hydroxyproline epimerase
MYTVKPETMQRIHVIDSHTAGEPTRIVVDGCPPLGESSMADRLERLRSQHDYFRSAVVNEPRGSNALVGAVLCAPQDPSCSAGVIFFNNVGYLGMCGHGTIGLGVTLAYLGRIAPGTHRIETPVGVVSIELHDGGQVTVANVVSYRSTKDVVVDVPEVGRVVGDVAWGGNWFFLTASAPCPLELSYLETLTDYTWRIRQAVNAQGFPEVDHIELFAPPRNPSAHSRNFVLCPGKEYDRSPCGTGTSAKLACLSADGKLAEGEVWRQESIIGTIFDGSYLMCDGKVHPRIRGSAFITADTHLILQDQDPFRFGIRP